MVQNYPVFKNTSGKCGFIQWPKFGQKLEIKVKGEVSIQILKL